MKYKTSMTIMLAAAALVAGCSNKESSSEPPVQANKEATDQQLANIKSETKAAAQDLKDYTYAQKQEFVQQMQTRVTALDQSLDRLSDRIDKSSDAVKAQAEPKVQALRDQEAQLKQQLDSVKDANESTWDNVKASAEKAYQALNDGFHQAQDWVSSKLSS